MNAECGTFRDHLAAHLRGRASLTELSWHEHLLACQDCRDLLEAEEALEVLLESLPQPRLPAHLAERVLARLEEARTSARDSLDRLLELSTVDAAPPDLARRIGAGIERKHITSELELDRLLDRVPAPTVPERLARDTLAALAARRGPRPLAVTRGTRAQGPSARWAPLAVAAAALALVASLWLRSGAGSGETGEPPAFVRDRENAPSVARRDEPAPEGDALSPEAVPLPPALAPQIPEPESVAVAQEPPVAGPPPQAPPQAPEEGVDEELLASLDVLEVWSLLNDDELDVLLSSLELWDEALLELEAEAREASPQERKNG